MKTICVKLCIVPVFFLALSAFGEDTLPLGSKTQASKKNPDTLEGDLPAPMVPQKKSKKKNLTSKDTLKLGTAEKEVEVEEPVDLSTQASVYIGSIDIYGTERVTEVDLKEFFGKSLDAWVDMGMKGDPKVADAQSELSAKAKKKWDFAFAEWSLAQYFTPNGLAVHLTLDVVEKKDAAVRLAFLSEPTEVFPDPEDLIKKWREYEEIALGLVEQGQLVPDSERCVAYHCPFGHKHASLKPFEKVFVEGAKKNHAALFTILKKDKRPEMRSAAAFVLPYYKSGKEIVEAMLERIPDPDPIVRNNVLRVLGDIAEFHRDIPVPLPPVLKAFQYPRVSDRSKALVVAYQLVEHSVAARELVRREVVPQLLMMIASKQPDHRELAHGILRKISGRDFPVDDEKSWQRWYRSVAKDSAISRK